MEGVGKEEGHGGKRPDYKCAIPAWNKNDRIPRCEPPDNQGPADACRGSKRPPQVTLCTAGRPPHPGGATGCSTNDVTEAELLPKEEHLGRASGSTRLWGHVSDTAASAHLALRPCVHHSRHSPQGLKGDVQTCRPWQ